MATLILVDLVKQEVTASEGGKLFHTCDCVSGDNDHTTPTGKFKITRMHHPYTSKKSPKCLGRPTSGR